LMDHFKEEVTSFEELEKLGNTIDWESWGKRVQKLAVDNAETVSTTPTLFTNSNYMVEVCNPRRRDKHRFYF